METICPKCGHRRSPTDDPSVPQEQCPACGVFYHKVLAQMARECVRAEAEIKAPPQDAPRPAPPDPPPARGDSPVEHAPVSEMEKLLAETQINQIRTSHVLHLLLSIFTAGIWLIVWWAVAAQNTSKRNEIRRRVGLPLESNAMGIILFGLVMLVLWAVIRGRVS